MTEKEEVLLTEMVFGMQKVIEKSTEISETMYEVITDLRDRVKLLEEKR